MSILNGYLDNSMVKKEYGAAAVDINLGGGEKRSRRMNLNKSLVQEEEFIDLF